MVKKKADPGIEEGVVYLSSFGSYYAATKLSAETIRKYSKNVYGAGIAHKQKLLIFQEKYQIEVLNPQGEPDEKLAQHLTLMTDSAEVSLWPMMMLAWQDVFWYGMSLYNPVWGYQGNEYVLQKLRHLPADSFGTAPYTSPTIYSEILKGVVLNPTSGEIEYYQTIGPMDVATAINSSSNLQKQLKNIFAVKDPAVSDLAGYPTAAPIIPIITMLDFSWQAQVQKVNRVGAPIFFLKITNPAGDDLSYGQKLLNNWGRNTSYQLRTNFEMIIPDLKDNSSALETINALSKMIIDYFSPISLLGEKGAGPISGSSNSEQELLYAYIRGVHQWISDAFSSLLQVYLDRNAYTGYTARIIIPSPSIDKSEIWLKQADLGAKYGIMTTNELRNLTELSPLDEAGIAALRDDVTTRQGSIPSASPSPAFSKADLAVRAMAADKLDPYGFVPKKEGKRLIQSVLGIENGEE